MSDKLLSCPFCDEKPDLQRIGNDFTKKRSIVIKCPRCRISRTDSALRHGLDWLEDVAVKQWNTRAQSQAEAKLEATILPERSPNECPTCGRPKSADCCGLRKPENS